MVRLVVLLTKAFVGFSVFFCGVGNVSTTTMSLEIFLMSQLSFLSVSDIFPPIVAISYTRNDAAKPVFICAR